MAIIGTIRKNSQLAVIIVGVAIAAFVLSDLFKGGARQAPPIAVVNGEEVSYLEFSNKLDRNLENARINLEKENLSQQEIADIRETTWNEYMEDLIMGEEYSELGLIVTPDELFDQVQGPDPHPQIRQIFFDQSIGAYNPQMVISFLQNLDRMEPAQRQQWLALEQFIKRDRLSQKYKNLIAKGYYIPGPFAQMDFENKRKTAEIRYMAARYTNVSDSLINPTDEDYREYYEENKYQWRQEATRDIDYVVFDVLPSDEDREEIRKNFMRLYEEFKTADEVESFVNATSDERYDSTYYKEGELPVSIDSIMFNSPEGTIVPPYEEDGAWHMAKLMEIQYRPDSMKASHILISYRGAFRAGQNVTRSRELAEELADSLHNVVRSNKSRMGELAGEYSDDPSAAESGGDLGWFADGAMVYPFNEAVIEGNTGDVTVVESVFGYHVIHITDKQEAVKKVRVAEVVRSIEPSSQTYQEAYTEASRFAGENSTQDLFEQAVIDRGLNKRTATYLSQTSYSIPGIDNAREIVRWAFYDGIKLGEVSPVFDVGGTYVVAMLKDVREKGTIPFEQIRDNISTFVMNDKKADFIMERLEDEDGNIYQLASIVQAEVDTNKNITFSSRNIPGFGSEFKVIGHIFSLDQGQQSDPLQGNGAVFVVVADQFTDPEGSSNLGVYKQQIESAFNSRVTANYMFTALKEEAEIEDNRLDYF